MGGVCILLSTYAPPRREVMSEHMGSQVPEAGMHRKVERTLRDPRCRRLGRRGERGTGPACMGLGLLLVLFVSTLL